MLLQDNSVCPWIAFYPLVSKTQASFPTGGFFPLYVYFPTPVPKKKSATEHTWLHRQPQLQKEHEGHLFCYILQSKADITFRRSPPEQYSIARRGTSLTRKFISSGTSQAFTTLGWFNLSTWKAGWKLLTPLLEEWDNRLSTNYVLCFRYNFCFPNISLLRSTLFSWYLPASKCIKPVPWEYTNQWWGQRTSQSQGTGIWWWGSGLKFWIPAHSWQSHYIHASVSTRGNSFPVAQGFHRNPLTLV